MNDINLYDLYKYENDIFSDNIGLSIFSKISNYQIIVYFILLIILLIVTKHSNNFSYVFICFVLIAIFIFYSQKISTVNYIKQTKEKKIYLLELGIDAFSLIATDSKLLKILYDAKFIKESAKLEYKKIINRIENFLVIYETLNSGINNIYLKETDMIKPFNLRSNHHTILIHDLRDQLELVLKGIQSIIHVLPQDLIYLDAFYQFNQIIKSHLSRYYNKILFKYNYIDHTSQYLLNRTSEDKYYFLD
jgi:hypothetical protein